ncbi:DUF721 domain-containing protein [Commensalibacter nepenthis]|uniref:DUF721 domain-containing protein n=1 Tax=Commensalibacter nepenthis TaxID=3043872 RepID=A0ABT6Q546_9PROT|nr:DUF721 domain-containing protein [Commensalibacter sp. TBRC 10068]MDI2112024.1 DUF721 domain-containing protein [Commensalibacter sp. TBRC 10068]
MDEQNSDNDAYYSADYPVNKTAKRNHDMYQIAGSIQKVTRPIFKQKTLSTIQLITDWNDIIGHHYGNLTFPYRLVNGTLTIACSSTTAAEMHYISNNIMQKINIYCGKPIVTTIKFLSNRNALASLSKKPILPIRPPAPIKIDNFPHSPLQEALARLGGHLQSKHRGK